MASILNQCKAAARIAVYLLLAYAAIQFWQDPSGSADATVDFVGAVGRFFASLLDRLVEFARRLAE